MRCSESHNSGVSLTVTFHIIRSQVTTHHLPPKHFYPQQSKKYLNVPSQMEIPHTTQLPKVHKLTVLCFHPYPLQKEPKYL